MDNYCSKCGTSLKPEWKACPNCGNTILEKKNPFQESKVSTLINNVNPYHIVSASKLQKSRKKKYGEIYGFFALIFALVGLFFGYPIGIVAIIIGALGVNKVDLTYMSYSGIFIGIVDLICFFIASSVSYFSIWGIFGLIW